MKLKCEAKFWKDGEYCTCGKPAVAVIKDVVCTHVIAGEPFPVCKVHRKSFMATGEHYKLIKEIK